MRDGEGEVGRESKPDGDAAMVILYCTRASGLGMEIVPTVAFALAPRERASCAMALAAGKKSREKDGEEIKERAVALLLEVAIRRVDEEMRTGCAGPWPSIKNGIEGVGMRTHTPNQGWV